MAAPRAFAVGVVTPDRRVWVIGGLDGSFRPSRIVQSYNAKADSWRREARLPVTTKTDSVAVADRAGRVFLFLGGATTTAYVYQPSSRRWVAGPELPTSSTLIRADRGNDGRIYVFQNDSGTLDVDVLDPATKRWVQIRYYYAGFGDLRPAGLGPDGRMWFLRRNAATETYDALAYVPTTGAWTTYPATSGAPHDYDTEEVTLVVGSAGQIYWLGGYQHDDGDTVRFNFTFKPTTGQWTAGPDFLTSVSGMVGVRVGGLVYRIGGRHCVNGTCGISGLVEAHA